jgi:peptide deformylase
VSEGRDRNLVEAEEGCLSLPGAFTELARADAAAVDGLDHTGTPVHHEGTGMLARCLQHESDHLAGMVFADRLPRRSRKRLYQEAAGFTADFPMDWPVSPRTS